MTNQEAIELLKDHEYWTDFSWMDEVAEMAIEALEKVDKYRWHNLLKDPNDLPPIDERVELIFNVDNQNINQFGLLNVNKEWAVNGFITHLSVIAWRYIEPFEVKTHEQIAKISD